jgi:hypothetical protein
MTRIVFTLTVAAAMLTLFSLSAVPASTADDGKVRGTIAITGPCVTLASSAQDFGSSTLAAARLTVPVRIGTPDISVTNCAAGAEWVYARGTAAVGTAGGTWSLGIPLPASGGNGFLCRMNTYALRLGPILFLSTVNSYVAQVFQGSRLTTTTTLIVPCTGSAGVGETMGFDIFLTAVIP